MRWLRALLGRILDARPRWTFGARSRRKALLSFVPCPPGPWKGPLGVFYRGWHNNRFQSRLMVETLLSRGLGVDVQDCRRPAPADLDGYSLLVGHHKTFSDMAARSAGRPTVLITTGRSPEEDLRRLEARWAHLVERHPEAAGLTGWRPPDSGGYAARNFAAAPWVFMIGGPAVRATWPPAPGRVRFYHNVSPFPRQRRKGRTGAFLFMASVHQLRRGLDLVLDAFAERKETIYVCAPYEREKWFMSVYGGILRRGGAVAPRGFVDAAGASFRRLVDLSDFVILPSCSEGESGSVINLMRLGLVPVVTPEVGVSQVPSGEILISGDRVEDVRAAVERAAGLSDAELERRRDAVFEAGRRYDPEAFMETFSSFLDETEGAP